MAAPSFSTTLEKIRRSEKMKHEITLPTDPTLNDLEILANKVGALTAITMSGQSYALRVPLKFYSDNFQLHPEAENTARLNMTTMEIRQFDMWMNDNTMPSIDWSCSHLDVPISERQLMSQRAVAMQRVWNNGFLSAEHASWVSVNMIYTLPLISAVIKINAANLDLRLQGRLKKNKTSNFESLADLAGAEMMLDILDVAGTDVKKYMANAEIQAKRVQDSIEILQTRVREDALTVKRKDVSPEGVIPKEEPIDSASLLD